MVLFASSTEKIGYNAAKFNPPVVKRSIRFKPVITGPFT